MIQSHYHLLKSSCCAVLICSSFTVTEAQSPEGLDSKSIVAAPSTDALSTREEALRRKEAELLRAISSGDTVQAKIAPEVASPVESLPTDSAKSSPPLEAPVTAVKSRVDMAPNVSAISDSATETSPEIRTLQEMGNHPALEPKKISSPRTAQKPEVTNRSSSPNVRKPDTFRRVERDREEIKSSPKLFGNSRTVSLAEIEAERDRPAPLEYEAVATIASRDATLRAGPRSADRALGSAPRFSEVSIDYRTGEWYRVQTMSGLRGWIQGRNLLFDAGISGNSTVRIGAVKAENITRQIYRR